MKQPITGYHKDFEDHWVAELVCGHAQHVRHDPPWQERPWVVTEEGRNERLGTPLNCVRCDEMGLKLAQAILLECEKTLTEKYNEAGVSGLCEEGRLEFALDGLKNIDLKKLMEKSLSAK